jgi:H+/Cl- antiporter ClcA
MNERASEFFSRDLWLERGGTWIAGAAVAMAAVGYAWLVDEATRFMHAGLAVSKWLPFAVTPIAFTILAALTQRYFPAAAGSGIPNAMAALQTNSVATLERLFNLKMILARMVLSATAILFGASVGREGPTVHVGAAIAYKFGRLIPHHAEQSRRRALILAGGAAGIAAAFNTPLAGIVSLAIGAGLGQLAGSLPGLGNVPGLAVIGTCAYLTGATQAPMTAFVIVMEMTGLHDLVLPLMVAALVSAGASRLVSGSLYHGLAERLIEHDEPARENPASGG